MADNMSDSARSLSLLSTVSGSFATEENAVEPLPGASKRLVSRNREAQKRYRDREKKKRQGLEDEVAVLTKRVSQLQSAHDSLANRNRTLERLSELADAKEQSVGHGSTPMDLLDNEDVEDPALMKFAVLISKMLNVIREPEKQLTAEECKWWHRDPQRFKAMKIDNATRLYEICGQTLTPSIEIQQHVAELVTQQRKLKVQLMESFQRPPPVWMVRKLTNGQHEVATEVPAAFPELVQRVGLSADQIEDLIKARRRFLKIVSGIATDRSEILLRLKLGIENGLEAAGSLEDHLMAVTSAQKEVQDNLEREGSFMKQFARDCMEIITPWQETKFILEALLDHGILLELWDIAVYYDNQDQLKKAARPYTDQHSIKQMPQDPMIHPMHEFFCHFEDV